MKTSFKCGRKTRTTKRSNGVADKDFIFIKAGDGSPFTLTLGHISMSQISEADELHDQPFRWPSFGLLVSLIAALLGVYLVAQFALTPPTVRYRICNGTSIPLNSVRVLGFENLKLGVGEFSTYREGSGLVREVGIRANASGRDFETIFDDHVGEPLLPKGTYTVAIVMENPNHIRAVVSDGSQCK